VVTIDARGHGKSDKPHDPAQYTMELRASDVRSVLDELGVSKVNYWGYSMGARTGFAFAQYHGDRLGSMINGAAGPASPKNEETRITRGADALRARDYAGIASAFGVTEAQARVIMAGNDLDALAAAQLGLLSWDGVDPRTLRVRSLHYAGERDPLRYAAQAAASAMPYARFVSLPGLDHLTGFTSAQHVLSTAMGFLG
jgi:pimeloyl-ACP methyl ester carboxylesterase